MENENKTTRSRTLLLLGIPFILILCGATIVIPITLIQGERGSLGVAVLFGIFGFSNLVLLTVFLLRLFTDAGRSLDPITAAMGLRAERYLLVGRRYRGEYAGRAIEIEFMPPQWNRRALLNIRLAVDTGTRIALFRHWPPLDCADCPEVHVDAVELGDLTVRAEDPIHVDELLNNPDCRATLGRLFERSQPATPRDIYIQPARIWLRTRTNQIDETLLREWIDGLETLAACYSTITDK